MAQNILHRSVAASFRWVSHLSGASTRRARSIQQPRILMYHIVGDAELSVRQFEWQMRYLRQYFEPTRLGVLVDRLQAGTTTGREVALTFDDGVQNHFRVAWPLLQAHDIPATFFVCPGLIESGDWLWRTGLRMRLNVLDSAMRAETARNAGCPATEVEAIMEWTKGLPMDARLAFERDIESRTAGFTPPSAELARHAPLTWDQLREMDESLITIGSHTRTHPILPTLTESMLLDEIAGSRAALEEKLDRTVDLFSYPNGANNPGVASVTRRHYRAAVTTRQGLVAEDSDPFLLPRVPAANSPAAFTRRMHRPTA
jgi:peptidoglycan/xylan/chitin deacetylase (PgdA/CDA1 family)